MTLSKEYTMDNGQSWLIFFCSFAVTFIAMGQLMTFGLYFLILSDHFDSNFKETAMIGAVCFAMANLAGPLAGVLQERYGVRLCVISGGLLSMSGMLASYFAHKVWHLYISYGILVGVGYGLACHPSMSVLPEYFQKYRHGVTTLLTVGGSLGTTVLSPLTMITTELYTWRGSMLINAGLCAQLVVFGALMKSRRSDKHADCRALLNCAIFKDCRFSLLILDSVVMGGAGFVVFSLITELSTSRGLTTWESASLLLAASLSTTISRVLAAFLGYVKCVDLVAVYTYTGLMGGFGVLACVFCVDFWSFLVALSVFGFSFGVKSSQLANVLIDLFGAERIPIFMGYFMFAYGFGGFLLPLTAGWIADRSSMRNSFIFIFIAMVFGFKFCCIVLILRRRDRLRLSPLRTPNISPKISVAADEIKLPVEVP